MEEERIMTEISLAMAGGEARRFPRGVTVEEALRALVSNKERKRTVAVQNGEDLVDLSAPLTGDAQLIPITTESEVGLRIMRHSAAHLMAQAVMEIFGPEVKVAIGPAVEDGFYYDFDRAEPFTPDDFERIEARVAEIVAAAAPFARRTVTKAEAMELFAGQG